ncbi:hypothetical protein hrd7_15530 [Leptolinea sp. HRD-7]|nr:hypothetical protein hrd7_15530 [Leptolinea sp. HRD-7]
MINQPSFMPLDPIMMSYLTSHYEKLVSTLLNSRGKLIKGSAILTLMKINSNNSLKIFTDSSIKYPNLFNNRLDTLETLGLIRKTDAVNLEYIITFLGLWQIESSKNIIDINLLLEEIQSEKIRTSLINQPLNEKEKLIIFSLLSLRSFSISSSMDLNVETNPDNWLSILNNVIIPKLKFYKVVAKDFSLLSDSGNEHPIRFIMRRANNLSTKTDGLFSSPGNSQYFLAIDILDKKNASNQISFLLRKVFAMKKSYELNEELKDFLCSTPYNESLHVTQSFEFIQYEWDSIIREAVDQFTLL